MGRRLNSLIAVAACSAVASCSGYPKPQGHVDAAVVDIDAPMIATDAAPDGPQGVAPTAGTATVTGTTDVGRVLTATPSGFSLGMPAGTYHYQWQRCSSSACTAPTAIGGDAATYTLVAADGGAYIRAGIYATNSCASGCGSSTTAYSGAEGAVRRVDLAKGALCSVSGCMSSSCRWMQVTLVGFGGGNHTITCNASNTTNPFSTYTTSSTTSNICCYGFPGETTWAFADGLRSNNQAW